MQFICFRSDCHSSGRMKQFPSLCFAFLSVLLGRSRSAARILAHNELIIVNPRMPLERYQKVTHVHKRRCTRPKRCPSAAQPFRSNPLLSDASGTGKNINYRNIRSTNNRILINRLSDDQSNNNGDQCVIQTRPIDRGRSPLTVDLVCAGERSTVNRSSPVSISFRCAGVFFVGRFVLLG